MKIGKWVLINQEERAIFIKNGGVISPSVMIGDNVQFCFPVHVSPQSQIKNDTKIDKFSFLNWSTIVYPNTYIGSYCSIGRSVEIGLAQHPLNWLSTHTFQYNNGWFPALEDYKEKRKYKHIHDHATKIGSDVWIGNGAMIVSGISVGHGAIIAAGAVVVKDVPAYAIVGGIPAKIIKYRFDNNTIEELIKLKWWNIPYNQLKDISFNDIHKAILELKTIKLTKVNND